MTGGLVAVIVVLEGAQHLYQFHEQWITYRSTAEALKHERYLYLASSSSAVTCLMCGWGPCCLRSRDTAATEAEHAQAVHRDVA
jgi:hypothetical protein